MRKLFIISKWKKSQYLFFYPFWWSQIVLSRRLKVQHFFSKKYCYYWYSFYYISHLSVVDRQKYLYLAVWLLFRCWTTAAASCLSVCVCFCCMITFAVLQDVLLLLLPDYSSSFLPIILSSSIQFSSVLIYIQSVNLLITNFAQLLH
jgi:hypothetical protein